MVLPVADASVRAAVRLIRRLTVFAGAVAFAAGAHAAPVRDELKSRWEGRWVVVRPAFALACGTFYGNVVAGEGGMEQKSEGREGRLRKFAGLLARQQGGIEQISDTLGKEHAFAPGELGLVQKLKPKGDRVDLLIDVRARVLDPYEHGPFTLYRGTLCMVQFQLDLPKQAMKRGALGEIEAVLAETVERYESEEQAMASPSWNRRRDEPYPDDYEQTLAAYADWRNAEVERGLDSAMATIVAIGDGLASSYSYLQSFAIGVDYMLPIMSRQSCERLVGAEFETYRRKPRLSQGATTALGILDALAGEEDDSGGPDVTNHRGYEEGQRLTFALALVELLPACRISFEAEAAS